MDSPGVDPAWLVHAKLAFAALCGGITRLYLKPAASFLKTIWLLFGCVTCGYYATPVVMRWWELGWEQDSAYAGGLGAAIGFIGLSIAEVALRAADKLDLKDFLRSILLRRAE